MPLPYTDEPLLIVALELLRRDVVNLPLAIAMNMGRTAGAGGAAAGGAGATPPGKPPSLTPAAFDRPQAVLIVGPRPLPVTIVGGAAGGTGKPKGEAEDPGALARLFKGFVGTFVT